MKKNHLPIIVLSLVFLVIMIAGSVIYAQGAPEKSEKHSNPISGTAPEGQGENKPSGQVETADQILQSYNATLRVPAAALKPRTSNVEWQVGGEGGCTFASSGNEYTWWSAPLYLPDGSTLHYFRMYYDDQNATIDSDAYLTVYDLYGRIVTEWGIQSSGTGQNYATTAELDHVINYDTYSYVIHWRPNYIGSGMQVCGFRIYYDAPNGPVFLPLMQNQYE